MDPFSTEVAPFGEISEFIPKSPLNNITLDQTEIQIKANNDLEAIRSWLDKHKNSERTVKTYKREGERLYLWCLYKKGSTLKQLRKEDFEAYLDFIQHPPKAWCTTKSALRKGRNSAQWRPFLAGLKGASFHLAVRAVSSLINYLVQANYLKFNPLKLIKHTSGSLFSQAEHQYQVWDRMLDPNEWSAIQKTLLDMPETDEFTIDNKQRTQFLFALLYLLGLRIHEVATHHWNAFRKKEEQWWFFVKGKGGKLGHVPVNDQLLSFMISYRIHLGKNELPDPKEADPLFFSKRTKKVLSIRRLYDLVREVGIQASKEFENGSSSREKLEKFSPHWLRHLSASHQDKAGIPLNMIKENHRHRSVQTTQIYIHSEAAARFSQMQKIQMDLDPKIIFLEEKTFLLTIMLRDPPACEIHNFMRFINAIENRVLKSLSWNRAIPSHKSLVEGFAQKMKIARKFTFCYDLKGVENPEKIKLLKTSILREAEVRLFRCSVEISKNRTKNHYWR